MPAERWRTTPAPHNPAAVAQLRRALDAAEFTHERVKRTLGADDQLGVPPHQAPLVVQRLGDGALATLLKLFYFGLPVSMQAATAALAPLSLQAALSLGIVTQGRSRVHPAIHLMPASGGIFASDLESHATTDMPSDFVMGVGESSRLLAALTSRRPVESALDLGSGSGYHAVLAAHHAGHVIATDVNPRALAFSAFNAQLNGATNIECRQGPWFAPVEGLTFDLIVSNPPFVISPDRSFVYRDSGLDADRVSRELLEALPSYLRPGGLGVVLVSWVQSSGSSDEEWAAPLQAWVSRSGCSAWFIREGSYTPLEYAAMWNQRFALAGEAQRYTSATDRWLQYFAHLDAGALGYGAVVLRRRDGPLRLRSDDLPSGGVGDDAGTDMDRLLELDDWLAVLEDGALLEHIVAFAPGHRLEQTLRWRDGSFKIVEGTLVSERGLRPRVEVDHALATLFSQVDGVRTVETVVDRAADALGQASAADRESFRADALSVIRQLIAHGFLQLQPDSAG
jgi:methylase of polypeptide subunit release factors